MQRMRLAMTIPRRIVTFHRGLFVGALASGTALAAIQNPPRTTQPPTFRAETIYLEVDARVTDKHHQFVSDLRAGDFQLLEDGKPQTIATFSMVDVPYVAWSAKNGAATGDRIAPEAALQQFNGRVYEIGRA